MTRRFALSFSVLAFAALLGLAQGPDKPKAPTKKSTIKVTVPADDAELTINKTVMKTPGTVREYDTPELEVGASYEYDFIVKWEPNNYTKITRTKTVAFKGGDPIVVDLTKDEGKDRAFIRYVPTPDDVVKKMLELGKMTKEDTVFDLGCGDGRLVIAAAKAGAKKGVGIDLDPERVKDSKANVEKEKVGDKVEIRQGDLFDVKDLGDATLVLMYLSDELGAIIQPKLVKDLKPGTRVVSHRFTIGDWKPEQTITVKGEDGDEYTLHLWIVKK